MVRGDLFWGLQGTLDRRGLGPVAGVDEAGAGACAGPLVVAACVLKQGDAAKLTELTDSKMMTAKARDRVYDLVLARAVDYSVIVIPTEEVDLYGIRVMNLEGMRRAAAALRVHPGYILTDGFRVPGLTAPNAAVIKGDRSVACIAAASVLAKVTRDRIMAGYHDDFPHYGFDVHKGYSTSDHVAALREHGPSDVHRWSYTNVATVAVKHGLRPARPVLLTYAALEKAMENGDGASLTAVLDEALEPQLSLPLHAPAAAVGHNERSAGGAAARSRGGARIS
ncbi:MULTISPECIES: ribonuclease HII [unclassified Amycolatopsis]|uniref:ribonuclease HII n=1 Tax=unclassified Amycolatopsis TaxID=2618356 RepID=UPI002876127D|nr:MULTISPECIES: ribonuclease HII [unclassified Amycolatopsis]MDS0137947.1 ribonuclease HII [Amycolatopsis sp. 505]MDS0144140.1 ribonuclease HII [Amycolatopsis sp. CM201R]